ncbi:putative membrane protein [Caballeronia cordobensis]|nr:putative membrane protein [Burkholderia sp. RPE67]
MVAPYRKARSSISGVVCCVSLLVESLPVMARDFTTLNEITRIVASSPCTATDWNDRGRAPRAYLVGMSLVFAKSVCDASRADVVVASRRVHATHTRTDGLAVYESKFKELGLQNGVSGLDTLRHTYLLLLGLGMRESSGKYCEGRDVSQCFVDPKSAEAGPFQTSWGVHRADPTLSGLMHRYHADKSGCMLEHFKDKISCRIWRSRNRRCPDATSDVVGTGPGAEWQRLTKTCPAFATEYAAVVLRTSGGLSGEFNPIRKQQAQLIPACEAMLKQVQTYVTDNKESCSSLP